MNSKPRRIVQHRLRPPRQAGSWPRGCTRPLAAFLLLAGVLLTSGAPVAWVFDPPGRIIATPAINDAGRVHLSIAARSGEALIAALENSGQPVWELSLPSGRLDALAIAPNQTLYACDSQNGKLYAIDPSGAIKWELKLDPPKSGLSGQLFPPAVTGDGVLVVLRGDGALFGIAPDGRDLFRAGVLPISASLGGERVGVVVAPDGTIIVQSSTWLSAFHPNGAVRWISDFAADYGSPPAIADNGLMYWTQSQALHELTLDGKITRRFDLPREIVAKAMVDHAGNLVCGLGGGSIAKLSTQGEVLDESAPGVFRFARTSITVVQDGSVYLGSRPVDPAQTNDFFVSLSPDLSAVTNLPVQGWISSDVNVGPDGTIYLVATRNDLSGSTLTALRGSSPLSTNGWPISRADYRLSGNRSQPTQAAARAPSGLTASSGTFVSLVRLGWNVVFEPGFFEVWRSDTSQRGNASLIGEIRSAFPKFDDQSVAPGKTYYYWVRMRNLFAPSDFSSAVAGSAAAGAAKVMEFDAATQLGLGPSPPRLTSPALAPNGKVYVLNTDGLAPNLSRTGQNCFALTPGLQFDWVFKGGFTVMEPPAAMPAGGFVLGNGWNLHRFNPDGTEAWRRPLPRPVSNTRIASYALGPDGRIYLPENKTLLALDSNGEVIWKYNAPASVQAGPSIGPDGSIVVSLTDQTLRLISADNVEQWSVPLPGEVVGSPTIGADGVIYVRTRNQRLMAIDSLGSIRWDITDVPPAGSSIPQAPVLGPERTVYYGGGDGFLYSLHADGSLRWRAPAALDSIPAVATDGSSFVNSGTNLICLDREGLVQWRFDLPALPNGGSPWHPSFSTGPPLLTQEGILYFTAGLKLIAIQTSARPAASGWPMLRASPAQDGRTQVPHQPLRPTLTGSVTNTGFILTFRGEPGLQYNLEASDDLTTWSTIAVLTASTDSVSHIDPTSLSRSHRFYRLRLQPH